MGCSASVHSNATAKVAPSHATVLIDTEAASDAAKRDTTPATTLTPSQHSATITSTSHRRVSAQASRNDDRRQPTPNPSRATAPQEIPAETKQTRLTKVAADAASFLTGAVEKVQGMEELPPGGAVLFEAVASSNSSELGIILTRLCGGAVDVLAALKPAASIAGPVLVVAELLLRQLLTWHSVSESCTELRSAIVALTPLLEDFAASEALASRHGALLVMAGK
jgi:hypothetical protein